MSKASLSRARLHYRVGPEPAHKTALSSARSKHTPSKSHTVTQGHTAHYLVKEQARFEQEPHCRAQGHAISQDLECNYQAQSHNFKHGYAELTTLSHKPRRVQEQENYCADTKPTRNFTLSCTAIRATERATVRAAVSAAERSYCKNYCKSC